MLISISLRFGGFFRCLLKLLGSLKKTEEKLYSGNSSKPFGDQCDFKVLLVQEETKVCSVMGKKIINIYQAQLLIYFCY